MTSGEQGSAHDGAGQVAILMAVYNGADHLAEQLGSFVAQSHANWRLVASDDGSADDSGAILRGFAEAQATEGRQVDLRGGPRRGATANFMSLLVEAPQADWLALSDQDDVWLPDRLARGIAALTDQAVGDRPALYCSRTWITDEDLKNQRLSVEFRKPPGFHNALVQNIAAGNTMLMNRAAADLVRDAAPEAVDVPGLPAHDWWIYQIVTGAGGVVIRDPAPTLLYRQHAVNEIGANDSWRARARRIGMVLSGVYEAWNAANIKALNVSAHRLTADNRALLETFCDLRGAGLAGRLRRFRQSGIYRQTRFGQAALWLALLLGKL